MLLLSPWGGLVADRFDKRRVLKVTQAWLAVSDDPAAAVSGGYFSHQRPRAHHPAASDVDVQEGLLAACADLTGVALP